MINVDIGLGSIERINEYTYNIPHERPLELPQDKAISENLVENGEL